MNEKVLENLLSAEEILPGEERFYHFEDKKEGVLTVRKERNYVLRQVLDEIPPTIQDHPANVQIGGLNRCTWCGKPVSKDYLTGWGELFRFCPWTPCSCKGAWQDKYLTAEYVDFFALRIWEGPADALYQARRIHPKESHPRALAEYYVGDFEGKKQYRKSIHVSPPATHWMPFCDAQTMGLRGTESWTPDYYLDDRHCFPSEGHGKITHRYAFSRREWWNFHIAIEGIAMSFEMSLILGSRLQIENLLWEHVGTEGLYLLDQEELFTPVRSGWAGSDGFLLRSFLAKLNDEQRMQIVQRSEGRLVQARQDLKDKLSEQMVKLGVEEEGALNILSATD